ncbi:hypothetical protein CERZMDRAFT_102029 [Cercospora zeae-maydis SCOH1-5]|uniref:Uncharacterized protein n=1 Tax=Cercospora zeae-maydis SCOH1-5 TaxID=717836 RepID=A0A6A6F2T6_9PEZI|nr:hypothetical protein CERZMDRAFT_102029 [Cercospora zeae-maydis SCOH1-5]
MSTTKPSKDDLIPHITFQIPSLKDVPKHGTLSKEERLKTIISNIDKHQQGVRHRIVHEAKQRHQASLAAAETNPDPTSEDEDRMDISPDSPPPNQTPSSVKYISQLLESLQTPYHESQGDPVTTGPIKPPSNLRQKTPPPEIQAAKEALDKIELYDTHARPAKKFYTDALMRLQSGGASASGGSESRKASTSSASDPRKAPMGDERRCSTGTTSGARPMMPNRTVSASGSVVNWSADPRLMGGSFSGSSQHPQPSWNPAYVLSAQERTMDPRLAGRSSSYVQQPNQSPQERTADPRLARR